MVMNYEPIRGYENLSDKAKQILCAAAKATGDNEGLIQLGTPETEADLFLRVQQGSPKPEIKLCLAGGVSMTEGRRESADCERAIGQLVDMDLAIREGPYYYTLTPQGYQMADENCSAD